MRPRLVAVAVVLALFAGACSGSGEERTFTAEFSRAVQLFPGVKVKVLGATIVPISLLGERYLQLFPAYSRGPELAAGSTIPLARTSVPAEGDELLAAMQEYMGELDGDTVEEFVTNAAVVLEDNGEELNRLIRHGTEVVSILDSRRDELANMVVQFDRLARALSTRQDALGRLINSYNVVGATVVDARSALEGTITGLNDASAELAGLLIDHRTSLGSDIRSLTRTSRTLEKNVDRFARTGKWAEKLFLTASRAIDFDRHWLRLSNQGAPIVDMVLHRLEDRLVGVCLRLGSGKCQTSTYWEKRFPELFCSGAADCGPSGPGRRTFDDAVDALPREVGSVIDEAAGRKCKEAKHPRRCRKKKEAAKKAQEDGDILDDLDDVVGGVIDGLGGDDDGGLLP